MRQPHTTRVDVAALHEMAQHYDAAAQTIDDLLRSRLAGLAFDGTNAGRVHAARGEALRCTLEPVIRQLRQWVQTADAIAVALRASANRYADQDHLVAGRMA